MALLPSYVAAMATVIVLLLSWGKVREAQFGGRHRVVLDSSMERMGNIAVASIGMDLACSNLSVSLRGRSLLKDVSFHCDKGSFTAVLGYVNPAR